MIFSSYEKFKKNLKKNNFSQIYTYQNINNFSIINNLLELVSLNKNSFVYIMDMEYFLYKQKIIAEYEYLVYMQNNNKKIIDNLELKEKIIKAFLCLDIDLGLIHTLNPLIVAYCMLIIV